MATTSGAGILGFGPQAGKGVAVVDGNWYRHKALQIGLGVVDGQQIGPQEVGGRPLPGSPYKSGVSVGGAVAVNPRLQNSLGWLLFGALGYQKPDIKAGVSFTSVMDRTLLTSGSQVISTGLTAPSTGRKLVVRVWKGDGQTFTGSVIVAGSGGPETFNFSAGASGGQREVGLTAKETIVGNGAFTTVTSVTLPGTAEANIFVSIGWEDTGSYANVFTLDPLHPARVKWMGFRKFVPGGDDDASDYGLGETYNDCKILGLGMTLPNDGLISSQISVLGRTFSLEVDPDWGITSGSTGGWNVADGEFETYESIPIGCQVAGYVQVPAFDGVELPVLNGAVTIANTPIDARYERIFGSPFMQGVTIGSRSVAFDLTVVWRNPDLYRMILTGSRTGFEWSAKPFTTRVDILAESPDVIPTTEMKYGMRVEAANVMLAMQGAIPLAGNEAIAMRFSGVALDTLSDYVQFTLTNAVNGYTWAS
jgi:hypothetical protein